jgi:DHA3 family multidrug efflux protein-like MFS transporter
MQAAENRRIFHHLLANTLIASVTNAFVWFALTFWVYLETKSVLAVSSVGGCFAVANMLFAFFFGGIVDHHTKHRAMMLSSVVSLGAYAVAAVLYFGTPREAFNNPAAIPLWGLVVTMMIGSVAGNLRMIALSTVVSQLFTDGRDKANGLVGTVNGVSFSLTSVFSGLAIGFADMNLVLVCAIGATLLAIVHLTTIRFEEPPLNLHDEFGVLRKLDLRGTFEIVKSVPGLFALIFFTTFNNFIGGVFMALMDAYGLSLVSVQTWGMMFAILSFGFIGGSTWVAKHGLGPRPLRSMLLFNTISWTVCIFFPILPSAVLLGIGILVWMTLTPFTEATEQTVIQTVVPYERQGRVFGFAQSIESAATPITAFMIGPIAEFFFIPFMTTGAGVALIGGWFGVGPARGMALVFITAGFIGLAVTLLAFQTRAYAVLTKRFAEERTRLAAEAA